MCTFKGFRLLHVSNQSQQLERTAESRRRPSKALSWISIPDVLDGEIRLGSRLPVMRLFRVVRPNCRNLTETHVARSYAQPGNHWHQRHIACSVCQWSFEMSVLVSCSLGISLCRLRRVTSSIPSTRKSSRKNVMLSRSGGQL